MNKEQVTKFKTIFEGFQESYGFYNVDASVTPGEKVYGKRATVREPVTTSLWEQHLQGEQGLGICPINKDSLVRWACIDIDVYAGLEHKHIVRALGQSKLPFVVCRTKSGGAHVYVFFTEFGPAEPVRAKLREVSACLGHGDSEIFPKQIKILPGGHLGSWVNLPYFNGDDTTRYAYDAKGNSLSLDGFLKYVDEIAISHDEFLALSIYDPIADLEGASPCVQYLAQQGIPEGSRNNALQAFAVFAKKKFPDEWQKKLEKYNRDYFSPPLPSAEVAQTIKNHEKKDYQYQCKAEPLCSHCDAGKCRMRTYGIGVGGTMPVFGHLQKLDTSPPIWFLQLEGGGVMELATDELQNFIKFQRKCMETTNTMPTMKQPQWCEVAQALLEKVEVLPAPAEASPYGHFIELLMDYLSGDTPMARNQDEILLGYPYPNQTTVFFQLKHLMKYLHNHNFKEFSRNRVASSLRKQEAQTKQMHVQGNCVRGYTLLIDENKVPKIIMPGESENDLQNPDPDISLPDMPETVI